MKRRLRHTREEIMKKSESIGKVRGVQEREREREIPDVD